MMLADTEISAAVDLDEPSPDLLQWAKEHIGEDPDTRANVIEEFKDVIYAEDKCSPKRIDDAFLLRFLRARNFSVKHAYKLFLNYHKFREDNPHFFEGANLNTLEKVSKSNVISVPPYRDQTGKRMIIYKFGNWNPDEVTIKELFQATLLLSELGVLEHKSQILGGSIIFDCGGINMKQAFHLNLVVAQNMIRLATTDFPLKVHAAHIVNQSMMFSMLFKIFKPLLNETIRQAIFFHGTNYKTLHEHIHPQYLADSYGGLLPPYDPMKDLQNIRNNFTVLEELRSIGYEL